MLKRRLLCLSFLLLASCVQAASKEEDSDIKSWVTGDREQAPPPTEEEFSFPDLTKLNAWHAYPIGEEMGKNKVEIAADSLSVGKTDRMIRYAIAIIPPSGLRNTYFEAIDCYLGRYRSYAWAQPDGSWNKNSKVVWRMIQAKTVNAWQADLFRDFCGYAGPYPESLLKKAILRGEPPYKEKPKFGDAYKE